MQKYARNQKSTVSTFSLTTINLISTLLLIVGVLVILTNMIVEVLKKVLWNRLSTNILAVIVALVLSLIAFFAIMEYLSISVLWFYVAAAIIVGFMVAYAAMVGYNKFKEALLKIKELKV